MLPGGEHPTLADLAIGCELYQIKAVGYRFGAYPRINAWLSELAARPHFSAVSEEIDALGQEIKTQESDYLALDAFD
ncbi:glutathione binding-like protein [Larsenimonas suaedae]|uniref:Glutathione binding-like protein n=1 Tax=Larsenimonas suaedae TaxID=1851019 RepID=A0ABU1GVX1_9GAMM|nr:glutathione binding-like protein [Larsenimonas suaedae]MCM2973296.1 glutathione binding-like protein [Larsenimonas suaedae]MDR5896189.1 glutathione binding-like protein [Larsenimonas suaedae]